MRSPLAPRLALFALAALTAASLRAQEPGQPAHKTQHIVLFKHEIPVEARRALAESAGAKVVREMPFVDGLLIELPAFTPNQVSLLRASPGVEALEDNAYRKWIEAFAPGRAQLTAPDTATAENGMWLGFDGPAAAGFRARAAELVKLAGEIGIIKEPQGDKPASEPAAPKPPTNELPWGIERVKAPQAWSKTQGQGVKVGVIDTGIDNKHPDLAANYKGGFNAVDPAADPFDDQGHGTHVAGTIAAVRGNGGVAGVAPKASLYAIKVLDADGGGTPAGIVDGIEWAVQNGMQVVNMSLGGPSSAVMRKAVKAAVQAGVTVVAASGNDPNEPVSAPARYPESICVSASTKEDQLAFFSTVGPEVDFIGPGHEVWSDAPGRKLAMHSGTSMATPHVAGLAALAVSLGADSPAAVKAMLQRAAKPIPGLTADQQGAGIIEADRLAK